VVQRPGVVGVPLSRTARTPAEPRLTSEFTHPYDSPSPPGAVEPGATPRRHSGPRLPALSSRHENGPPTPSADRHETSRLVSDHSRTARRPFRKAGEAG
jgi:hypothetical protein